MTAPLPMGAQKITGMADPTAATDGATKNYVDTTTATFFGTGDVKLTLKTTPDSGWLMFDDGTFGSASSGSSNSNNIANLALFTLLFSAPFTDANVPILTSGGGATTRAAQVSASAAWAANCRMSLPKALGRALGIAGSGSGLTARVLGQAVGLETATLGTTHLPPYTPAGAISTATGTATPTRGIWRQNDGHNDGNITSGITGTLDTQPIPLTMNAQTFAGTAQGGVSTPFSIIPPISYFNAMVKT